MRMIAAFPVQTSIMFPVQRASLGLKGIQVGSTYIVVYVYYDTKQSRHKQCIEPKSLQAFTLNKRNHF